MSKKSEYKNRKPLTFAKVNRDLKNSSLSGAAKVQVDNAIAEADEARVAATELADVVAEKDSMLVSVTEQVLEDRAFAVQLYKVLTSHYTCNELEFDQEQEKFYVSNDGAELFVPNWFATELLSPEEDE